MAKVSTNITIDAEVKAKAQALLADFGMDLSTAVNIFLKQMVYDGAFPFEITRNRRGADDSAVSTAMPDSVSPTNVGVNNAGADFELPFPTELGGSDELPDDDELLLNVLDYAVCNGKISSSMIQRKFGIGFARASKIVDRLEELGYVSSFDGGGFRRVNLSREVYERFLKDSIGC